MDKALKQRLVGASVLIILAVIVLPMLLSGRSDTLKQESRQIELPPKPEELSIETRRFPVGLPNKPAPASGQEADPVSLEDKQQTEREPVVEVTALNNRQANIVVPPAPDSADDPVGDLGTDQTEDNPVVGSQTSGQPVEQPPRVTSITLSSGKDKNLDVDEPQRAGPDTPRYLVQVASFSSEKRANALADQLRSDGLPVLMDVVDRAAGRLHRVRIGPYEERFQADAIVTDLRSRDKDLAPRVLDLRPEDSAPVSTPSDPLVRWVVQVGSFSNEKSAEALVAELRLSGLTAFAEKVTSGAGSVYKVRIGPELDRDKATQLKTKVKADHGLDGFVTTQE